MTTDLPSVRFYVRTQKYKPESLPIRIKVWSGKRWLYCGTDIRIPPQDFRRYVGSDGTTSKDAPDALKSDIARYILAVHLVWHSVVVLNDINNITSEYLNRRVNGVADAIKGNMLAIAKGKQPQPIRVGATPPEVEVCQGCAYAGKNHCQAPWLLGYQEAEVAPEFAAHNGLCCMRKPAADDAEKGGAK